MRLSTYCPKERKQRWAETSKSSGLTTVLSSPESMGQYNGKRSDRRHSVKLYTKTLAWLPAPSFPLALARLPPQRDFATQTKLGVRNPLCLYYYPERESAHNIPNQRVVLGSHFQALLCQNCMFLLHFCPTSRVLELQAVFAQPAFDVELALITG